MAKKLNTSPPNLILFFLFLVMLAICEVGFFYHGLIVGSAEMGALAVTWIVVLISQRRQRKKITAFREAITLELNSEANLTVAELSIPAAVVRLDGGGIVWSNDCFQTMSKRFSGIDDLRITDVFENLDLPLLIEILNRKKEDVMLICEGKQYRVSVSTSQKEDKNLYTLVFIDSSREVALSAELKDSRPVVVQIQVDNADELQEDLSNYDLTFMMAGIESAISAWAEMANAIMLRNERGRYTLILEDRFLRKYIDSKFDLLDQVRNIKNPSGMPATLSIGVGREGKNFSDGQNQAKLAMDMALSRGGDQAVIRNRSAYEFFGGNTREIEKRTKVRSRVIAGTVQALITESKRVIIMGHKYSDMDSLGASCGVNCICRKLGVEAYIVYDARTTSARVLYEKLHALPEYENTFVSGDRAMELINEKTLLIVVDTNRPEIVDAPRVLEAASSVVVIDHHRRASNFIENAVVSLHEPYASSASELVTEMLTYIGTPSDILRAEAECLLAGIMLDTKNFTMKTGVRTFEAAAFIRRAGADTIEVKCLFQNDMQGYFDRCDIIRTAEKYRSGVAIAYSEKEVAREIAAQAADELLTIEGIQGSFVVFRFNNSTNISGRSLGKINVQIVLERMGGGGSMMEAGAQLGQKPVTEVIEELKASINAYYSMIQEG